MVAVTGTNGKTTTSRMIAHIARTDGQARRLVEHRRHLHRRRAGRGRRLLRPQRRRAGARATRRCELAVTETARGGILLKGIGLTRNDVSVVTNVSADHLGLHGIDTVDQLAEVKAVVPQITRKDGWAVLNGDDPRVFAMRGVDQGAAVGVLPRPRLARRSARCSAPAAGRRP